jgi:toxin ParE1/3/4
MISWDVVYTEHAESDLRDIYNYIAFSLLELEVAKRQLRRILDAIAKLNTLPLRHPVFSREPWLSKGLRVMPVDHFLVFYIPVESQKTVAILRIMYGGRDIENQLFSAVL